MEKLIDKIKHIQIIQVGVGGTGSWLVSPLIKFLINLDRRFHAFCDFKYYLFDDDIVESHNCLRQNFSNMNIGESKASAVLLNANIEQNIIEDLCTFSVSRFPSNDFIHYRGHKQLTIILGCVDNNKTRLDIYEYCRKLKFPIIYIDSGNTLYNGQIITSTFNLQGHILKKLIDCMENIRPYELYSDIRYNKASKTLSSLCECIDKDEFNTLCNLYNIYNKLFDYIPKNINFKKMFSEIDDNDPGPTCAFFGDQSQSINMFASTLLFINLQKILIENVLPPSIITFNNSGYSTYEI